MRIFFANDDLQALCLEERRQTKKLGAAGSRKLRSRLADLAAATCVPDLVAGRPHPLKGERAGQFAVDLDGGRRLVFEPETIPAPVRAAGGIDWAQVTAIRILFIGDYHD